MLPPAPSDYEELNARHAEAGELVVVGIDDRGRDIALAPAAALAWSHMQEASQQEDVRPRILSGFRSVARQAEIMADMLESGISLEEVLHRLAYPGFSEHHTGRAIDFASSDPRYLRVTFDETAEYAWLCAHARDFGFFLSYPRDSEHLFEPGHWFLR